MTPVLEPRLDDPVVRRADRWMLVIHNNDVTPFDDVVESLMEATRCDLEEAAIEAWEAHHYGKAPVHFDEDRTALHRPARIINRVGVVTEIVPEFLP